MVVELNKKNSKTVIFKNENKVNDNKNKSPLKGHISGIRILTSHWQCELRVLVITQKELPILIPESCTK